MTMQIYGFTEYGGPDVEGFLEVPSPTVTPGTVLIEMSASAMNPGDIKVRSGGRQGQFPVHFPMAMGREAAGIVIADPAGHFHPGQLIFGSAANGYGTLGEQVLLEAAASSLVPDGVAAVDAACLPVAIGTAWDALHEVGATAGTTVLVLGAGGGVGVHATALARHLGARVIGLASARKRDLVIAAGAEYVDRTADWATEVQRLAPQGVDAVIDTVGGDTLRRAAHLVSTTERIRSVADVPLAVELGGCGVTRRRTRSAYAELAELVARGNLKPVVGSVFPFTDASLAVAAVASGSSAGKVVVTR